MPKGPMFPRYVVSLLRVCYVVDEVFTGDDGEELDHQKMLGQNQRIFSQLCCNWNNSPFGLHIRFVSRLLLLCCYVTNYGARWTCCYWYSMIVSN